jgi:hypothetical protein
LAGTEVGAAYAVSGRHSGVLLPGNDFIAPGNAYRDGALLPLVDESAGGSLREDLEGRAGA